MGGRRGWIFLAQSVNSDLGRVINRGSPASPWKPTLGIPQIPVGTLLSIDVGISKPGPRGQYQACQHICMNLGFLGFVFQF